MKTYTIYVNEMVTVKCVVSAKSEAEAEEMARIDAEFEEVSREFDSMEIIEEKHDN